ncbi:hypothetical protein [Acinetobacter junii]|uniref:hypothetical protein n=1 Tax=Acinetobacter junii TaxID=40215 RepID=UPI003215CCC8
MNKNEFYVNLGLDASNLKHLAYGPKYPHKISFLEHKKQMSQLSVGKCSLKPFKVHHYAFISTYQTLLLTNPSALMTNKFRVDDKGTWWGRCRTISID